MTTGTGHYSSRVWWSRLAGLLKSVLRATRAPKRLRLCESLPLGERRFVAVVEFDKARFLVGGTANALVLLSRLADAGEEDDAGVECAGVKEHPRLNETTYVERV